MFPPLSTTRLCSFKKEINSPWQEIKEKTGYQQSLQIGWTGVKALAIFLPKPQDKSSPFHTPELRNYIRWLRAKSQNIVVRDKKYCIMIKNSLSGVSGCLSWLGDCLRLGSRSQSPRVESHIGFPAAFPSDSLPSHALFHFLSLSNK